MNHNFHAASLSSTTVFAIAAVVSIVFFILYAVDWNDHRSDTPDDGTTRTGETHRQYLARTRTEYAYSAAVVSLLFVIMSMHGGVLSHIF